MSLEDMHKTHENLSMKGVWVQRGMLVGKWARQRTHILVLVGMLLLIGAVFLTPILSGVRATSNEQFTAAGDWSTYGYDNARDNFNAAETIITPATAPQLKQKWVHAGNNGISDQIAAVNGQLEVFVGGGNANFYALNASNGSILWHRSLGPSPSTFIWDSPAYFNGSIYIATSSFGDCPLNQSRFFRLNAATGAVQNTFNIVPSGCTGGGVWGSPTIDESAGHLFFATGNSGPCNSQEPNTFALVELHTSDLSLVSRYQLPPVERPGDSDFGSTPTLFTTSTGTPMVGVANKNGKYYAFNRNTISAGPVWKDQVATGGGCPQCGSGSISPSAWDGHNLYIGGGKTSISGSSCMGGVRKVNPDNGSYLWQHCMGNGPVLGSVTATASGVVAASQGNTVIVMNASTGATVARMHDLLTGSKLYGGPSISNGVLFVGNIDGNIYAYSPNGQ